MAARTRAALHLMAGREMGHDEAEAMIQAALDEHAHDLAEKIRAEEARMKKDFVLEEMEGWAAASAADFIDPEVT